jgi:hypothetical protein
MARTLGRCLLTLLPFRYYACNSFECWRPLFWRSAVDASTFINWLITMGPERIGGLTEVVLLYKHESELDHDINEFLWDIGFDISPEVISAKLELSEYEMSYEALGLPRQFGSKKKSDRWWAASQG